MELTAPQNASANITRPLWAAVIAMSVSIFGLVGSEFLPASMLTLMARDMKITEGLAGQAVTATAAVAIFSSLLIATVSGRTDRRKILLFLSALLVASNSIVALADSFTILLAGRLLLGVSLGGFWALSASIILRLVPAKDVPKALSLLFAGVSGATVFAAPFGSWLGALEGWRAVFVVAAILNVIAFLCLWWTLPNLPSSTTVRLSSNIVVLRRPFIAIGVLGLLLSFAGHFSFFTYLRTFLEQVDKATPSEITIILFLFGLAGFVGTSLSSWLIKKSLSGLLKLLPLTLAILAMLLALNGGSLMTDTMVIVLWGGLFGLIPVSWSTWITRVTADQAETGGGLVVAASNIAITIGASIGGFILDYYGVSAVLLMCSITLLIAALVASKLPNN